MHARIEKRDKNKSIWTSATYLVFSIDGTGAYILSGLVCLYTCLYNIFLNVEAVHRLEKKKRDLGWFFSAVCFFWSWHLLGVFLSATVVFYCSPQQQSVPAKTERPGDRVEESRKQCHVDFQLETCRKRHTLTLRKKSHGGPIVLQHQQVRIRNPRKGGEELAAC